MHSICMNKNLSNLITPPDFVKGRTYSVVLIDPAQTEIEDVTLFLMASKRKFNVYLYRAEMNDEDWLNKAVKKSNAVVVNTVNSTVSKIKDQLVAKSNAFYYGDKRFIMNNNRIEKPIDFFAQLTTKKENNVAQ